MKTLYMPDLVSFELLGLSSNHYKNLCLQLRVERGCEQEGRKWKFYNCANKKMS